MVIKEKLLYKELAKELVYPERFGRVAMSELFTPVEYEQLPEINRLYQLLPGDLGG